MKIIGGLYKGRMFKMPKGIRPTQDVLRKSLFDILREVITDSTFLDLFAGSGAVGLEAFSRGAKGVVLVEKNQVCAKMIKDNAWSIKGGAKTPFLKFKVLAQDVFLSIPFLYHNKESFDIIFLDPPYYSGEKLKSVSQTVLLAKKTLQTLGGYDILSPNGLIICQHSRREVLPEKIENLILFKQKRDGDTVLSFYRRP
ncbi:MAG: 16S rRNA (guanine(966)-N(2))-methyltransferase RsmD [Candidatus Omnitrophota bacterium]|nr:16S rRNA (guanine(966)-N(2))-methyltransferase RsmD [Candidatus Omnitrophota bacterium]